MIRRAVVSSWAAVGATVSLLAAFVASPAPAQDYSSLKPSQQAALPEGFALPKPRGARDAYVFARIEGTSLSTIDRKTIEGVCDVQRQVDPSSPKPLFESGWDAPDRFEAFRFTNAKRSVQFTIRQTYVCSNFASLPPNQKLCGCQYRREEFRTTHFRRAIDASQTEDVSIDHAHHKVRRSVVRGQSVPISVEQGVAYTAAFAPIVAGSDVILGLECTIRQRDLGGGARLEWCVTPNDAKLLKDEWLRGRSLRYRKVGSGDVEIEREQTTQIVPNVWLDDAAFVAPAW